MMNKNLLIIGAGCCGMSAKEIAETMGCFEKIDFLDDTIKETQNGCSVLGKVEEYRDYSDKYGFIFVAIGNAEKKLKILEKIKRETNYQIATLVSPRAYVSPSATIMQGTIVEAMATINTGSVVAEGCIIGAGSVVNHCSMCCNGVHIECNGTVADYTLVPVGTDIGSGTVFDRNTIKGIDLFFDAKKWKEELDDLRSFCISC